ncbi:MAG: WecB/TagA/CpsF family glycosyltransferase [Acidaminobacteraceae bacterium]
MDENFVKILGIKISKLNMDEAYNAFLSFFEDDMVKTIYTPNTEIVMQAQNNNELKEVLHDGDLVIPDGIGLIYASKIHGLGLKDRVTGVDLMDKILKYCNSTRKSIYILGGKPEVAKRACDNILQTYPNIRVKGFRDGYFNDEDELKIVDKINEVKPDILFVALGAPKQEIWIDKHKKILNTKVAMGVGGGVDIWAGTSKRAPKFFQNLGLEWLYRLILEPSRIGRMMALPKFMIKVLISRDFKK